MSQENVEVVRALTETAGGRLDAGLEFFAPEIELHLTGVFPDLEPVYREHGVLEFVALFNAPWEELTVEVERFVDLGDQVLTLSYFDGTARDGIEVRRPLAHLWTLRDGKIIRMNAFPDHQQALEAVALSD